MKTIKLANGQTCLAIDDECEFRPCFRFGFDKGPFTQGVGYTSYYPKARQVCMTNHLEGCPTVGYTLRCDKCGRQVAEGVPCDFCGCDQTYKLADLLPDPQPCCESPRVAKPHKGTDPYFQRCQNCGAKLRGARLELARSTAPTQPDKGGKE